MITKLWIALFCAAAVAACAAFFVMRPDPLRKKLERSLERSDYDGISKSLSEIIYRNPWSEFEAVGLLEDLASSRNMWIRYRAIEHLYRIGHGDRARASAISIISNPSFVQNPAGGEEDLRITMANALGAYRDLGLFPSFVELYEKTGTRRLRDDLMKTSPEDAWAAIGADVKLRASKTIMEWIGMARVASQNDFINDVLDDDKHDVATRNAAAWAKTQIENDPHAARIIRDHARQSVGKDFGRLSEIRSSIIYLGTLRDRESVETLEQIARRSTSGPVIDLAVANLVINHQSRSSVGKDLIIKELAGGGTPLGRELAITLAAYMSDDPEIRAAGEISDQRGGVNTWRKEGLARKNWAFWSWADQYLILPPLE